MEKVEISRHPGDTASGTESQIAKRAAGHPCTRSLQIEARAARWWAAYSQGAVSNR